MKSVKWSVATFLCIVLFLICPTFHPNHILSHPKPCALQCITLLSHFSYSYWLLSVFLTASHTSFPMSQVLWSQWIIVPFYFGEHDLLSKANLSICAFGYLSTLELWLYHLSPLYLVTSLCYWIMYYLLISPTSLIRCPPSWKPLLSPIALSHLFS